MTDQLPDERPQRRREYSGAGSTLGIAMLIVIVVGVSLWFFEFRDNGSSGGTDSNGFGVVSLPAGSNRTGKSAAAEVGRAAPDFKLQMPDGSATSLDAYRGKYVLVNFWASWCGPCRSETPDLQRLYTGNSDKTPGIVVLGVNQQEDVGTAAGFLKEFGLSYPVVLDRSGSVSEAYRASSGLPISFLVDPTGVIQQIYRGRISVDDLSKLTQDIT
ncbi:MAG: TlpA disulfide reductase family protein [Tepidiformaceae bacterium]